jgi:NAD(P)H dehydrogenase (quinone)
MLQNAARDVRKVVITGANGGLGSDIIARLMQLTPTFELGVSTRATAQVEHLATRGVRVRHGDFDRPDTLDRALEGATRVLIISTRAADNAARFAQQRNAIDAARRCGAERVFYTSIVQRPGTPFAAAPGHFETEAYLRACGLAHTVLRNGHYMENLPMFLGASVATGDLALPPDGPTAWVSRVDLAEGIARLLLAEGDPPQSVLLTGSEALDFAAIAQIASRTLGRPVSRRVISQQDYIDGLVQRGLPRGTAQTFATGFASRAAGELAVIDPALREILDRPLRTVAEVLPDLLARAAPELARAREAS